MVYSPRATTMYIHKYIVVKDIQGMTTTATQIYPNTTTSQTKTSKEWNQHFPDIVWLSLKNLLQHCCIRYNEVFCNFVQPFCLYSEIFTKSHISCIIPGSRSSLWDFIRLPYVLNLLLFFTQFWVSTSLLFMTNKSEKWKPKKFYFYVIYKNDITRAEPQCTVLSIYFTQNAWHPCAFILTLEERLIVSGEHFCGQCDTKI